MSKALKELFKKVSEISYLKNVGEITSFGKKGLG
jgi:hypothetical protein